MTFLCFFSFCCFYIQRSKLLQGRVKQRSKEKPENSIRVDIFVRFIAEKKNEKLCCTKLESVTVSNLFIRKFKFL